MPSNRTLAHQEHKMSTYTAYTDGACRLSNPGLCCCGFVVYRGSEFFHERTHILPGLNTNNVSEFCGLIDLLEWAKLAHCTEITIYCDSKLVVESSQARWGICDKLRPYAAKAFQLLTEGNHILLHTKGHAGNEGNEYIDCRLNETLDKYQGIVRKRRAK
jgi:ribonuclease HI